MIIMKLKLTALTSPEKDDGQALPVAHFEGTSRALDSPWDPNANSGIRGEFENLEVIVAKTCR